MVKTIALKFIGAKHNYQAFQAEGMRGTLLVPRSFFNGEPSNFEATGDFAEPKAVAPKVDELLAQIEELKKKLNEKDV